MANTSVKVLNYRRAPYTRQRQILFWRCPVNEKDMEVYRNLMVEVRFRIDAIDSILTGNLRLRARIAEESAYLQLRIICEIIAIGCLIIHGDLSAKTANLRKTWQADRILKVLADMHPKFFPEALESEDLATDPAEWVAKTEGFLTRKELIALYTKHSGGKLHRGTVHALSNDAPPNFEEIRGWRNKIVGLLNRHTIISPDEQYICHFGMNNGQGQVHSALFVLAPDQENADSSKS